MRVLSLIAAVANLAMVGMMIAGYRPSDLYVAVVLMILAIHHLRDVVL